MAPDEYPRISELIPDIASRPAEIPVDMAEDVCSILYEFVGHLGPDVGSQGYEYHLVKRARELARHVQAAIITSVRKAAVPRDEVANARDARDGESSQVTVSLRE